MRVSDMPRQVITPLEAYLEVSAILYWAMIWPLARMLGTSVAPEILFIGEAHLTPRDGAGVITLVGS